jgi:signal transduction histidine kinase
VILRQLLLALAAFSLLASVSRVEAIERFNIDIHRDTALMPYEFIPILKNDQDANRSFINTLCRILEVAQDSARKGMAIAVYNGKTDVREPAVFQMLVTPDFRGTDNRVGLTVNDWGVFRDSLLQREIICGCGYTDDTAWAFRLDPKTGESQKMFLISTIDSTGKDVVATPFIHLISDYDYDGITEMIAYFDEGASRKPRVLFCVELETMRIQWALPMASEVIEGRTHDCRDSLNPAIMFVTNPSGQGVTDSAFSDSYGYLVKIDSQGTILKKRIIAFYPTLTFLVPGETLGQFYLRHNFGPDDPDSLLGMQEDHYYLSKIDNNANFIKSVRLQDYGAALWLQPFDTFTTAVYIPQQDDIIRVYNTNLTLIAESNRLDKVKAPTAFLGCIRLPGQKDESFVLNTGVFTHDWRQLLAFPFPSNNCKVAVTDINGAAFRIIVCGGNKYIYGEIHRRSFRELATIFYVDNQKYILMAVTALVVTLVLTNFYRRRTKRNLNMITQQKREIESTHAELERTYESLKEAQTKIIAQEKFLQAKSIAGGFAHEIRNALFPAEGAIHNLTGLLNKSGVTDTRIDLSINALKTATARAIQLTEVISNYAKLETPLPIEPIPIIQIVSSVLERNSASIESIGVKIVTEGDENCKIAANIEHLQAIFNNLLVNALDALTNTANPCIMITWDETPRIIRVRFSDNGSGIPEEQLGNIFEPFYSTKPFKGTGLGLSIVKKIIELYEGSIRVSSKIGKGTVFEIELRANNRMTISN